MYWELGMLASEGEMFALGLLLLSLFILCSNWEKYVSII